MSLRLLTEKNQKSLKTLKMNLLLGPLKKLSPNSRLNPKLSPPLMNPRNKHHKQRIQVVRLLCQKRK
jgi:hypothetical protein